MGPPAFGEAVLGASNPALATITKTATIRNNGNDCLQITAIADNAPYSLTAASRAALPVTLDPNQTFDVDCLRSRDNRKFQPPARRHHSSRRRRQPNQLQRLGAQRPGQHRDFDKHTRIRHGRTSKHGHEDFHRHQ